jgi:hypothetical protein
MDTIDPVHIVDRLDAAYIRARLSELDRQQRALRVLLRAAVARAQVKPPMASPKRREPVRA